MEGIKVLKVFSNKLGKHITIIIGDDLQPIESTSNENNQKLTGHLGWMKWNRWSRGGVG